MFTEPRVYGVAKNKSIYAIVTVVFIAFITLLDIKEFSSVWLFFLIPLLLYLFIPFLYKLIISDETISSINFFRKQSLGWNEITEIRPNNGGISLINTDGDIKVFINSQIDGYPEVVKLVQQKRSDLWKFLDVLEFHQNIIENIILLIMGVGFFILMGSILFQNGVSSDGIIPSLIVLAIGVFLIWKGSAKIHRVSLENEMLVIKYIFWKRQFHVNEVESVSMERGLGKNEILYPVYIKLKNGKQVILQKVKEGNPILLNALENWFVKYKSSIL
jgi:hypothetical protein